MFEDLALPSARIIGSAAIVIALIRFCRWAIEFAFGRVDMRSDRVTKRENALEARVEAELKIMRADLARYRRATMILVNALARKDPANAALSEVAALLELAIPVVPSDQGLDDLLGQIK